MATISARIKWATNLDELRRELKSGSDQVVVLEKAAERTTRILGGEGLMRAAHNTAAAIGELGSVSKLTAAEQEKVHNLLGRAIEKYAALGQTAPAALKQIYDATTRVEAPTSRFSGLLGDLGKQIVGTAAGFLSAQAILGGFERGFRTLTDFVGSSIKAYSEQESAVRKMTAALVAQGNATPDVINQYKAMASQFQATTTNGDELINEMQALLVQVGNVMPADMERALKAATDLSAGLGIDLRTATMLVGKAFEGETGTLKRYGIVIDETALKTQGVTAVLDAIQSKFGGQAQAEVETYAGKVKQLSNAWGDFKEAVGEVIVTDPLLNAALRAAKDRITDVNQNAEAGKRSLLEWWIGITGGAHNDYFNLWLVQAQEILRLQNEIAAGTSRMAPKGPGLFAAPQGPAMPQGFDWKQYLADEEKRLKAAADAAKAHAEAVRHLFEQYTGADKLKAAALALEAIAAAERSGIAVGEMTVDQQKAINDTMTRALDVYKATGTTAPAEIRKIYIETLGLLQAQQVVTGLTGAWDSLGKSISAVGELKIPAIPVATPGLPSLPSSTQVPASAMKPPTLPTSFWSSLFGDGKAFGKGLSQVISSAFMGGGDAIKSVGSFLGSSITGGLAKTLTSGAGVAIKGIFGGAINAILPGVGALMGPVLEKALGGLKKLFGMGGEGRKLVEDFAKSMGGFDALHQKLNALPTGVGEKLWKNLTQGVGRNNPAAAKAAIEAINKALERQNQILDLQSQKQQLEEEILQKTNAALEKYGLTWRDAGQAFQDAHLDQDANQLYEDMQLLQRAGVDNAVIFGRMRDNIRTYLADATKYASSVTDGFAKLLSEMIATGNATDDDYASMVAYVKRAMQAGIELPESMKPIIQKLIDMGLLTDQNGNKIGSLEQTGINFSQTTTQGFKSVVDKLEEISKKLSDLVDGLVKVGDEAVRQGGRIRGAFEEIGKAMPRIPAPPSPPPSPPGPQPDPNITAHTGGLVTALGVQRFGAGGFVRAMGMAAALAAAVRPVGIDRIPILAAPGEAILTPPQQDLVTHAIGLAAGAGQAPNWRSVTIMEVDKRELGRAVADVLPGELRRLGVKVRA